MRIVIYTLMFLYSTGIFAQSQAPVLGTVVNGTGYNAGLPKCPRTCSSSVGDFYVSTTDDQVSYGIQWFVNTNTNTNVVNMRDGLANTKELLKFHLPYGIDINASGLPSNINAANRTNIKTPIGAVETCFRKNYDAAGIKNPGANINNMWYLPSAYELELMILYDQNNSSAFGASLYNSNNIPYWTSVNSTLGGADVYPDASSAYIVACSNSLGIDRSSKSYQRKVRCIRQGALTVGDKSNSNYNASRVGILFQPGDAGYVPGQNHGYKLSYRVANPAWEVYSWTTAGQMCENLSLDGFNDWTLPSIELLEKLSLDASLLDTGENHWSSTEAPNPGNAYSIVLGSGARVSTPKTAELVVRCVRSF